MEVLHCLYICVLRQLAVRQGFFQLENFLIFAKPSTFFTVFAKFPLKFGFPTCSKMAVYHRTLHKYINWKTKYKAHKLIVKGLTRYCISTQCIPGWDMVEA